MKKLALGLVCLLLGSPVVAQDADLLLNDEVYHLIDRYDIQGRLGVAIPTTIKPYGREQVTEWLQLADTSAMGKRASSWHHRSRLMIDDEYVQRYVAKGVFNTFWTNGRDMLSYYQAPRPDSLYKDSYGIKRAIKGRQHAFKVYVNPILHVHMGLENTQLRPQADASQVLYRNTRGANVRGSLFGKVGFYTEVTDNQTRFPQYLRNTIAQTAAIPGEGFFKTFRTTGHDYLTARGYLTYSPIKQVRFKLGRDRAFWGDGLNSMHLSNHATDYYLLSMHARFWKLEYMSQFTQMVDLIPNKPDIIGTHPRKWGVFHHIAYRPVPQVSIGIFESIIYAPVQPLGYRGFELQYLNPLIFYRAIEQYVGSPDNYALGLTAKANLWKTVQLYGQVHIDDYNFGQRKNGSGWWGNKYGLQGGLKYVDVLGIETLDLQLELNTARPYAYSHTNISGNYAHYNQALAHPLGGNFRELTGVLRYQPLPRLFMTGLLQYLQQGLDENNRNYGANILRSNISHFQDFNNRTTQGMRYTRFAAQGRLSYHLTRMNCFLEGELTLRTDQMGETAQQQRTLIGTLGIRWNIPQRNWGL